MLLQVVQLLSARNGFKLWMPEGRYWPFQTVVLSRTQARYALNIDGGFILSVFCQATRRLSVFLP